MEKKTTSLRVPLSRKIKERALKIEQYLEWTNQTSTQMFIAMASVMFFQRELMMNDHSQTVVASNGLIICEVPFKSIWEEVLKRPTERWTLEDVPQDFVRACEDIMERTNITTPAHATAMSIGYMAKLVEFVEVPLTLFSGTWTEQGYGLDNFESSVLSPDCLRITH